MSYLTYTQALHKILLRANCFLFTPRLNAHFAKIALISSSPAAPDPTAATGRPNRGGFYGCILRNFSKNKLDMVSWSQR